MPLTQLAQSGHHDSRSIRQFHRDVVNGLKAPRKHIPCKYLYDKRGSELFDQICEQDEYYVTRTELQIMREHGPEMAHRLGKSTMLVELGSGSSIKTRILLDHLEQPAAYCPVDISREHLLRVANDLSKDYPQIEIIPIVADFAHEFVLPRAKHRASSVNVYFPGSTIGNFEQADAVQLLQRIAKLCQHAGGLLVGIDLQKPVDVIEAAYNDRSGVTDKFTLNLLKRINRELDADFEINQFRHRAFYDTEQHRVDISLVSQTPQKITIGDEPIELADGEAIHTEYSHKYTVESFSGLARQAGFSLANCWTDDREYFAVLYLVAD